MAKWGADWLDVGTVLEEAEEEGVFVMKNTITTGGTVEGEIKFKFVTDDPANFHTDGDLWYVDERYGRVKLAYAKK